MQLKVGDFTVPLIPFVIARIIARHGLKTGSLSTSGSFAAFVIGFTMMTSRLRTFGVLLIVFYFIGSRATKLGKERKDQLEDGHQAAGNRTATQVLCNSFTAFVASVLWNGLFVDKDELSFVSVVGLVLPESLRAHGAEFNSDAWCPLSPDVGGSWSRYLLLLTLGHFACCLGDTLASELGILSKSSPILITTFRRVPPGTNGAVSLYGTLASVAGGLAMGITLAAILFIDSRVCRQQWGQVVLESLAYGAAGGLFGSLIDSLLGAVLQRTQYSNISKKILTDESPAPKPEEVKTISGFNILTNNQVNLLSSIIVAFAIASLA